MSDYTSRRLVLPESNIPVSARVTNFEIQVGGIFANWNAFHFTNANAKYYLEHPDELIDDLKNARQLMAEVKGGLRAEVVKRMPPVDYWYSRGLWHPTARTPYDFEDTSDRFLTVTEKDAETHKAIGVTQYIKLSEHKAALEKQRQEIYADLNGVVQTAVERGVESGIQKNVTTLQQIEDERKSLERERERIDARLQRLKEAETTVRTRQPRTRSGYVYLLQSDNGYWKIGRTANPDDRLRTFNVKLPFKVSYKRLIKASDMYELEARLHTTYARCRVDGEWFRLTDADVNAICEIKDEG